jgi:hypothetical protein
MSTALSETSVDYEPVLNWAIAFRRFVFTQDGRQH